jgi:hypothetical protein
MAFLNLSVAASTWISKLRNRFAARAWRGSENLSGYIHRHVVTVIGWQLLALRFVLFVLAINDVSE